MKDTVNACARLFAVLQIFASLREERGVLLTRSSQLLPRTVDFQAVYQAVCMQMMTTSSSWPNDYCSLAEYCTTWVRMWWEKYLEIAERCWAFPPQMTLPSVFCNATVSPSTLASKLLKQY
jgi:hypothetical protein